MAYIQRAKIGGKSKESRENEAFVTILKTWEKKNVFYLLLQSFISFPKTDE